MFDEPGFPRGGESDDDEPILHNFVYCSRMADGVDDTEVDRIVASAQRRNMEHGITGVLVFGSGVFFQWIEGPPDQMENLITNLHGDSRHYDLVTLSQTEEKRERLYPNWEMERVPTEDIKAVLENALESAEDERNVATLKRIIAQFASRPLDSLGRA